MAIPPPDPNFSGAQKSAYAKQVRRVLVRQSVQDWRGACGTGNVGPQACGSQTSSASRAQTHRCRARAWVPRWRVIVLHVRRASPRDHVQQHHACERTRDDPEHVPR